MIFKRCFATALPPTGPARINGLDSLVVSIDTGWYLTGITAYFVRSLRFSPTQVGIGFSIRGLLRLLCGSLTSVRYMATETAVRGWVRRSPRSVWRVCRSAWPRSAAVSAGRSGIRSCGGTLMRAQVPSLCQHRKTKYAGLPRAVPLGDISSRRTGPGPLPDPVPDLAAIPRPPPPSVLAAAAAPATAAVRRHEPHKIVPILINISNRP